MPNRIIKSNAHASRQTLRDALSSIFALELFAPSKSIYLISPWISDFTILDNSFGQFRTLLSEHEGQIRLSTVLNSLVMQGSTIYILMRPDTSSDFQMRLHPHIKPKFAVNLHEKSLLTDHFYLRGSLNFTYSGTHINEEHVEISSDATDLAQARINAQAIYEQVIT